MSRVIIERTDTGAQMSVVEAEFKRHYPDVAYKVVGEESDSAFELQGVPVPKAARRSPRAKGAKGRTASALRAVPETPKPSEVISPPQTEGEPG